MVPKTSSIRQRNNKLRVNDDGAKGLGRRNFEVKQESVEQKPEERVSTSKSAFKRRTTTISSMTQEKPDKVIRRVKVTRKTPIETTSTTPKSRRQFTARSTSENVLVTTSELPSSTKASFKRIPFTRGNFRPIPKDKEVVNGNASDEENYPEHFKLLLKNKEANEENDKTILKKPLKNYRPSSVNKTTKSPVRNASKSNVQLPPRSRVFPRATSTTTDVSASTEAASVTTKRSFRRPRPTERTKTNVGSTLQEPPTAKSTPGYATRAPVRHSDVEDAIVVNTQADAAKQIDPPLREYFPRTSAVSFCKSRRIKCLMKFNLNYRLVHP